MSYFKREKSEDGKRNVMFNYDSAVCTEYSELFNLIFWTPNTHSLRNNFDFDGIKTIFTSLAVKCQLTLNYAKYIFNILLRNFGQTKVEIFKIYYI